MSLKVGAHVSIAGGVDNAVANQVEVGGNCGQIFTHSPQVWQDPGIGDEEAERFREGTERDLEGPWVIHTSYLVNLCTPKEGLREKSLDSMQNAHAFAAGYDLSTPEAVDQTIGEFDDVVGLEHLEYVHLNDSKHECGTNKDEHAHIGEGHIGEAGMERFLNHPDLADVPLALETPTEDGKSFAWNIERVRELRRD